MTRWDISPSDSMLHPAARRWPECSAVRSAIRLLRASLHRPSWMGAPVADVRRKQSPVCVVAGKTKRKRAPVSSAGSFRWWIVRGDLLHPVIQSLGHGEVRRGHFALICPAQPPRALTALSRQDPIDGFHHTTATGSCARRLRPPAIFCAIANRSFRSVSPALLKHFVNL
jgi:hypothetical protein